MGRPRITQRLLDTVGVPPDQLAENEFIVTIVKPRGNSLYESIVPPSQAAKLQKALGSEAALVSDQDRTILVLMPPKFRNTVFVKRGGYTLVELYDPAVLVAESGTKVKGDISNIVTNKREWQKMPFWPEEFQEKPTEWIISDEEDEDEDEDLYEDDAEIPEVQSANIEDPTL